MSKSHQLSFVDLFCGIGSFHYSFRKLGWVCRMACDINVAARSTYERNYGIKALGDVTAISPDCVPPFDILCAGFPCQPFSQCGKHMGFDDERGSMFFQVLKFVVHHHPPIVILENVPALLTHDNGKSFARIQSALTQEGYVVQHAVLKCSDYGIPQMRKRLFIFGFHQGSSSIAQKASDITDFTHFRKTTTLSEYLHKAFKRDCAFTIRCGGRHSPINDRHNWDGYEVGGREYRLTLSDALRLQGFAHDFQLCGSTSDQWKQVGNTIPTVFTDMIGRNIQSFWTTTC